MKNKIRIVVLIIIVIFILGFVIFSISSKKEYELDETITLKKHETISIKDTDLKLSLLSIGDSRCKKGWQCIWQGEIQYNIRINNDTVTLATIRQKEVKYGDYRLVLSDHNDSTKYVRFMVLKY